MFKSILVVTTLFFTAVSSQAATVGVVDSGFNQEHVLLKDKLWVNQAEKANRIDDDKNGLVDDIWGWNFANNSKALFDPSQIEDVRPLVYKVISISSKMAGNLATEEEKKFFQEKVIDLPDAEKRSLIQEVNFYGQYAHGTHVAGVVAKENPEAALMNLRFFPMGASPYPVSTQSIMENIEEYAFGALSDLSNMIFDQVAAYVGKAQVDVVNMSLGIPMERFAKWVLFLKGNKDPSIEELGVESTKIYKKFEARAKEWAVVAPNTLFVVASGNSGLDNDIIPAFPANVDNPNILSVAATLGVRELASFSNYGAKSVDVAAPGVAILSAAPGDSLDFEIEMSGTSMAAPYVAGVSSKIVDHNFNLTAVDVKTILMETVDVKDWLSEKVVSGGVINAERAYFAAKMSATKSLKSAISEALVAVPDQKEEAVFNRSALSPEAKKLINQIVF